MSAEVEHRVAVRSKALEPPAKTLGHQANYGLIFLGGKGGCRCCFFIGYIGLVEVQYSTVLNTVISVRESQYLKKTLKKIINHK